MGGDRLGRCPVAAAAHWALAGMVALALFATVLPAAENREPILLRDTLLLPPVATTGYEMAPEVKVRVSIDERGRVSGVEVLEIRPQSEFDEAIREHTVAEIEQWRYSPAMEDGKPVARTLQWVVQYKPGSESGFGGGAAQLLVPPFLFRGDDSWARHAKVMSQPLEKRKEILLGYSEICEKYIVPERRQHFASENFVVVTDSASTDAARIIAHNLDAALGVLHRLIGSKIPSQPSGLKWLVYIYSHRATFDSMRLELTGRAGGEATYYPPGLIVYHLELPNTDVLMSLLIHEATHGYSDHVLRRPGSYLPIWFEEGFAEYMGNSRIKEGELIPGKTLKRQYLMSHYSGVVNQTTKAGWDLERVKQAVRRREGLTLEQLVSADRETFYGEKAPLYYGESWLLVHFLRHGEPSWAEESFPTLMLYLAEGYPPDAAIEVAYGSDPVSLEERFQEYVRRF